MRKKYRKVELLGVPTYYQGTHDSLCTYYSAAMLLATLHPEMQDLFGRGARRQRIGLKVEDPLLKHFPRSTKDSNESVLSSWFYCGAYLRDACKALNASVEERKSDTVFQSLFKHKEYTHHDSTFNLIVSKIDQGLPVMIGWSTVDYGVHCSLVVGYRLVKHRWLILNDPSGGDEISWEVLKDIDNALLDLVTVEYHEGPRPDRLTVTFDDDENIGSTQIDRWWPFDDEDRYHPVKDLYMKAKGKPTQMIE